MTCCEQVAENENEDCRVACSGMVGIVNLSGLLAAFYSFDPLKLQRDIS